MRNPNFVLPALLAASLLLVSPLAQAKDYVVAISPNIPQAIAQKQIKQITGGMLEVLQPGDTAPFYNGDKLESIATLNIPNKPAYRHPKAKLKANAAAIRSLYGFAQQSKTPSAEVVPHAIQLPQLLREIARTHNGPVDVIVVGSPLYSDPQLPMFNMTGGYVPGLGHLGCSPKTSVFGTLGAQAFKGLRVHFYIPESNWAEHSLHEQYVREFWERYIATQGGQLVTFSTNLTTVLNRVKSNAKAPAMLPMSKPACKMERIKILKPKVVGTSIYQRPVTSNVPSQAVIQKAENIEIGLRWLNCQSCDIDLIVRPTKTAKALYYGETNTPEGQYLKDFQNAPVNGFETVLLKGPVNLNDVLIAANFYGGQAAAPVQAELRLSLNNGQMTFKKAFTLKLGKGNSGQGRETMLRTQKAPNAQWVIFDVQQIMGVGA